MSLKKKRIKAINLGSTDSAADLATLNNLLSYYSFDMSACLTNCSNQGACVFDTAMQQFACECQPYFSGSSCQNDVRPCSRYSCLNYGLCINMNSSFQCDCPVNFNGIFCEHEVNVCANYTCSGNGYCVKNGTMPACKCFQTFYGDACELEGAFAKVARNVAVISLVVCVMCFTLLALIVILNDFCNFSIRKKRQTVGRQYQKGKAKPVRFKYIN